MDVLIQDLRYACRMLLKRPGFTAAIILTLALGIGTNTAVFSALNAAVLRPLPFDDPDELVVLSGTQRGKVLHSGMVSHADLEDFRAQAQSFEEIGALRATTFTLTGVDDPERIDGAYVSSGFFSLLHVEASPGRLFRPEEDQPGADNVAVVSDRFWHRRFAGAPGLLGQTLMLDGVGFTVVGILPADFSFPIDLRRSDVWTTTALDAGTFTGRNSVRVKAIGRLKPGVTMEQAQAEMNTITRRLEQQFPVSNAKRGVHLASLHEQVVGKTRPLLLLLLGSVALVLLVACANVANMLLAQSEDRKREFAVRAALGAGRRRIVAQLLTENALIAFLGAGLGVLLAVWALDVLLAVFPGHVSGMKGAALDGRVLGFTLALTILTSLAFGLVPALRASRQDLNSSLKEGGGRVAGAGRDRLRASLAVSQVTFALVLLVGAGLFMRSFQRLSAVDPGFRPENILSFQLSIPRSSFSDASKRAESYRQVLARLEGLPGVQSAGASTNLPLHPAYASSNFVIQGRPQPPPGEIPSARYDSISAQYFQTLGVPLLKGRFFTEQDTVDRPGVTIINETMVRTYWPNEDPIGQWVVTGSPLNDGSPGLFEIVGIVGDQRDTRLDARFEPYMYVPYQQQALRFMCFILRTTVDPLSLVSAVRTEVGAVTKEEAAYAFQSMTHLLDRSVAAPFRITLVLSVFALAALGLAALGIYGTISYLVARQTHGIGVRMALGAQRGDVLRFVLKRGLVLTAMGLGIGLVVSLASTRVLSSLLYEIEFTDPATLASVSLLLAVVALLACYIPARRATKVDPMVALRYE